MLDFVDHLLMKSHIYHVIFMFYLLLYNLSFLTSHTEQGVTTDSYVIIYLCFMFHNYSMLCFLLFLLMFYHVIYHITYQLVHSLVNCIHLVCLVSSAYTSHSCIQLACIQCFSILFYSCIWPYQDIILHMLTCCFSMSYIILHVTTHPSSSNCIQRNLMTFCCICMHDIA